MLRHEYASVTALRAPGFFEYMDLHLANCLCTLVGRDHPGLSLGAALVSRATGMGHICLDLAQPLISTFADATFDLPQGGALLSALEGVPGIGAPGDFKPLILDGTRLYLARYHQYERDLAKALLTMAEERINVDAKKLTAALKRLFPTQKEAVPDMQKVAAFAAVRGRLTVITGGPGTGGSTTVARIVALLAELENIPPSRIGLAAPTGKAAARLSDSLQGELSGLPLPPSLAVAGPFSATTLHRLLGMRPGSSKPSHGPGNPLAYQVLIVDEASMVDLPLMTKLVLAMPQKSRLILLGDRDQLASVEAGAVLADICHEDYLHTFSEGFARDYAKTCDSGERLSTVSGRSPRMTDAVVALTHTWRFKQGGAIAMLSASFRDGKVDEALAILHEPHDDLVFQESPSKGSLEEVLAPVVDHAARALQAGSPEEAFTAWGKFQLLTPLRRGPFGVEGLNSLLERMLRERGAIKGRGWWYPGKPVMVRRNDQALRLFNGDIGVAMQDQQGSLKVFFRKDQGFRTLPPARLQDVDDIYAMTVHKSQGSEFDEVFILLPEQDSPVLTRELLYTALTRAKMKVTILGSKVILQTGIRRKTVRHSGLRGILYS